MATEPTTKPPTDTPLTTEPQQVQHLLSRCVAVLRDCRLTWDEAYMERLGILEALQESVCERFKDLVVEVEKDG